MEDRLESEMQVAEVQKARSPESPTPPASSVSPLRLQDIAAENFDDGIKTRADSEEFRSLLRRISSGEEPTGRELRVSEPKRFGPQHVQMVMLRLGGFKCTEIADMLGTDRSYVAVILRHPYARRLIEFLLPGAVIAALDIKAKLARYSEDLVDRLYNVAMRDSTEDAVVARIGFGILDRAGYAPVQKKEATVKHTGLRAPTDAVNRLSKAIELAQQAREIPADFTLGSKAGPQAPNGLPARGDEAVEVSGDASLDRPLSEASNLLQESSPDLAQEVGR